MRTAALVLATAVLAAAPAFGADPMEMTCKVYGPGVAPNYAYRTVVEAVWRIEPDALKIKPVSAAGGCTEVGRKSPVFGKKNGTRLQFGVWKCREDDAYYTAKVLINGRAVVQHIKGSGRVVFGEDGGMSARKGPDVFFEPGGDLPANEPVTVPEGKFRFLYFDCSLKQAATN